MKMKHSHLILAFHTSLVIALNVHAADAPADFPKAGLELWLSAGQVEQTDGTITAIKDLSGNGNDARRGSRHGGPGRAIPPWPRMPPAGSRYCISPARTCLAFKQLTDIRTAFWVVSKDPASFGQRSEKFVLGDKAPTISTPGGRTTPSSTPTSTPDTFPSS